MRLISTNAKLFEEGKRSLSVRNKRFREETAFTLISSAGTVAVFFLNPLVGTALAVSTVLATALDEHLQYQQHREDDLVIEDVVAVHVERRMVEMKGDRTLFVEPAVVQSLVSLKEQFSNIPYEVK